jgi:hypothetical protein
LSPSLGCGTAGADRRNGCGPSLPPESSRATGETTSTPGAEADHGVPLRIRGR